MIDLQSISNLPQLLPSLNTYLQPQQPLLPSSLLPQTQPPLYIQQSNMQQQQQQMLNSQLLQQQLLTQLLQIQQLEQQQNTLIKNNQVQALPSTHFNSNINAIPSSTAVESINTTQTIPSTLTDSAAAQLHLVAAAEALHDLSKQQHSHLSLI